MTLEKLLDCVIKRGFPELLNQDIQIEFKSLDDSLLDIGRLTGGGHYIEVDKSLKNASLHILIGGIAHELAHIIADRNETPFERLLYRLSQSYRIATERNTDLHAVLRGFAKELRCFMRYAGEKYSYYEEDGLSVREIEVLANLSR